MADIPQQHRVLGLAVSWRTRSLKGLALCLGVVLTLGTVGVPFTLAAVSAEPTKKPLIRRDRYYNTEGVARTPRAPEMTEASYPQLPPGLPSENRLVVWILAQQQTYWGAFVLGGFFMTVLFEFLSLSVRRANDAERYRGFAQEILTLVGAALVVAAAFGCLLLAALVFLYSDLLTYLITLFKPFLIVGLTLLVLYPATIWFYWSTWEGMAKSGYQWFHLAIGLVGVLFGALLLLLINGWSTFMLSPAGVDEAGRFLGNYWHLIHTATWNAFNLHRLLGHVVFAGAVVAAYAAYHAISAQTPDERTYYDRLGLSSLLVLLVALAPMPFEGYWLSREIYAYRQEMGITMFGGLLAWLGMVLASLLGAMLLVANYFIWQRIDAESEGYSYRSWAKYIFGLLAICMAVYITPHTMVMTPRELLQMGGQQHQVLGNYGVESGKQPAINLMILLTAWSLLVWSWSRVAVNAKLRQQQVVTGGLFLAAALNIVWLGIYGFYIPANVRVGLSVPTAASTFTVILITAVSIVRNLRNESSKRETAPPTISARGYYALICLAFIVTWVMGLGGYRRSALRLYMHVNEIMKDASPWAYTHSTGFAANVISLNALVFWVSFMLLLWIIRVSRSARTSLTASTGQL